MRIAVSSSFYTALSINMMSQKRLFAIFFAAQKSSESELSLCPSAGGQKRDTKLLTPMHPATRTRWAAHTVFWYQQSLDDDDCANKIMF